MKLFDCEYLRRHFFMASFITEVHHTLSLNLGTIWSFFAFNPFARAATLNTNDNNLENVLKIIFMVTDGRQHEKGRAVVETILRVFEFFLDIQHVSEIFLCVELDIDRDCN